MRGATSAADAASATLVRQRGEEMFALDQGQTRDGAINLALATTDGCLSFWHYRARRNPPSCVGPFCPRSCLRYGRPGSAEDKTRRFGDDDGENEAGSHNPVADRRVDVGGIDVVSATFHQAAPFRLTPCRACSGDRLGVRNHRRCAPSHI